MDADNLNESNAGRTCPNCGFASPAGDKFCSQCGHSLLQPSATNVSPVRAPADTPQDFVPLPPPPAMVRKKRVQKRKWYKRPLIMIPLILLLIAGTVGGVIAYQTRSAFKEVQSISTPPPEVSSNALGIEDASPIDTGPAQRALQEREQQRQQAVQDETSTSEPTNPSTTASSSTTVPGTERSDSSSGLASTTESTGGAQPTVPVTNPPSEPSAVAHADDPTAEATESSSASFQLPLAEPGGITVLLMGVDARDGESIDVGVRPDSLAVLHVDEETGSCRVLSVPRDSRTQLPGYGESKINHALAVGGIPYEMAVVEDYLGLSIDHYVLVDFSGLETVVDEFGGVTVENPVAFEMGGHTFEAGTLHLSGEQALLYARFRGDSQGDFGRISRQQQVLRSLLDEANNANLVRVIPSMFTLLADNFRTDYGVTDLLSLANDYRDTCTADTLETRTIPGDVSMMYDDMMQMELSFVTSTPEQVAENVAWLLQQEDSTSDPAGTPSAGRLLPVAVMPDRRNSA